MTNSADLAESLACTEMSWHWPGNAKNNKQLNCWHCVVSDRYTILGIVGSRWLESEISKVQARHNFFSGYYCMHSVIGFWFHSSECVYDVVTIVQIFFLTGSSAQKRKKGRGSDQENFPSQCQESASGPGKNSFGSVKKILRFSSDKKKIQTTAGERFIILYQ